MTEFRSVDPSTGLLRAERPPASARALERSLTRVQSAFEGWSVAPVPERARVLRRVASVLRERSDRHALLMAEEMGKPLAQGRAEVEKCAWACDYAASKAESWLAPEATPTEAERSYVRHDPLGPILAIMPWNFPFWQLFRFGASALAAGNTILLKHAPNVPALAEALEEIFRDAEAPDGLLVNAFAPVDAIERLIADPRIAGVSLTGSTRAGRAVAEACGRHLKPSVLELGGSDPFVVLEDADLDRAANVGAKARLQNNGQSCIAAKRFIVVRGVADGFLERFEAKIRAAKLGDPRDPGTSLGPLAREDLRSALERQVQASIAAGAACPIGGAAPEKAGWWYPATLLTGCEPGMPAWDEETFGPVAAVRVVQTEEDAIAAANASSYSLGASIWTEDRDRAAVIAPRLRAGAVFVNELVKSDPRLPFGGNGESGWGRELGREGMRSFTNTRSVWIG